MTVRTDAGYRLHRLLAVLTWLARVERAPVAELAERFDMTSQDLVADLELAACCGLPPYTPDQLMEIVVDDQEVVARLGPELARPRRLTAAEGFALAAAAKGILAVPGSDPDGVLTRALGKLESALGAAGGLRIDLDAPHLGQVRDAVDNERQLLVRYYSASSDEDTERIIDPLELVAIDGTWYLDAFCHRAEDMRRFRVDRLLSVEETGRPLDHQAADGAAASPTSAAFVPGPDAIVVRVAIDPEAMWLVDGLPTLGTARRRDRRVEVRLAVASMVWFERLLLRLGRHAEVIEPEELADLGRLAARRVLARYEEIGTGSA